MKNEQNMRSGVPVWATFAICAMLASACAFTPVGFAADRKDSVAPSVSASASASASAKAKTKVPASAKAPAPAPARNPKWAELVDKDMNLYRITPTFYRCEQFTKAQVPALQKLGIRTAVNLRHFHSDDDVLKDSGIKAVRVPTDAWAIDDAHVVAALADIRRAEAEGAVVVHCQHGADRTGVVCAMYRVVYQGWTPDEAIDELRNGGYGFHRLWVNIPRYIKKADAKKIAAAVEAKLAAGKF